MNSDDENEWTAAQKEELIRRMADLDADPGIALTWAEIKERARRETPRSKDD